MNTRKGRPPRITTNYIKIHIHSSLCTKSWLPLAPSRLVRYAACSFFTAAALFSAERNTRKKHIPQTFGAPTHKFRARQNRPSREKKCVRIRACGMEGAALINSPFCLVNLAFRECLRPGRRATLIMSPASASADPSLDLLPAKVSDGDD